MKNNKDLKFEIKETEGIVNALQDELDYLIKFFRFSFLFSDLNTFRDYLISTYFNLSPILEERITILKALKTGQKKNRRQDEGG